MSILNKLTHSPNPRSVLTLAYLAVPMKFLFSLLKEKWFISQWYTGFKIETECKDCRS